MGQFSWLDCKTKEQILDDVVRDVYVLVPKEFGGGHIKETCYDGYGHFGGYDIYDLVVDWNEKHFDEIIDKMKNNDWHCGNYSKQLEDWLNGTFTGEKRTIGIDIACYDDDNKRLKYPIKITHNPNAVYEDCKPSLGDPKQGWLMEEDFEYGRYSALIGFNSKQPWVYDEKEDVYIDPPTIVLEQLTDWRDDCDKAIGELEDIANIERPDWLNDKEYWYDADDYDI